MHVLIVFCHPSAQSLTTNARSRFIQGLEAGGHTWIESDLYRMGFNPVLSEAEYRREAFYDQSLTLPHDVLEEHRKLHRCDGVAFIFPLFWTDVPALLKGWFDRVWTYGFAYGNSLLPSGSTAAAARGMKTLHKALFLCIAGNENAILESTGRLAALKTVLLEDRIHDRARHKELVILGGTSRESPRRAELERIHLTTAFDLGRDFQVSSGS